MSAIDNPTRVKRQEMLGRLDDRQRLEDMRWVMSSAQGRRVMNDLLRRCGVGRLSFSGPGQAEQTAFYEGQRNIGNYYWSILTKNLKKEWLLMTEEQELKQQEKTNGNGNSDSGSDKDRRDAGNDNPDGEGA